MNRLICLFDKSSLSIPFSEAIFIEGYLRKVIGEAQDGVHIEISQEEASTIAIHTYLIINQTLLIS